MFGGAQMAQTNRTRLYMGETACLNLESPQFKGILIVLSKHPWSTLNSSRSYPNKVVVGK